MKAVVFPQKIKRGSVVVKIYRTPSHGCDSFTLSYYQDGVRKRPTFSTYEQARLEAEVIANRLGTSDADLLTLTSADRAAYLRARQLLDPLGVALEAAAAQFAEARQALGETPLSHAVAFFLQRHPTKIDPKPVHGVIAEFVAAKQADGGSARYVASLRYCMGKFEAAFKCDIASVTSADIDDWLRKSGLSPRSRNNLRNAVKTLFSYAKARRYLPKEHDEIEAVPLVKAREGSIEIFSPAEMVEIMSCAEKRLIPFFALAGFAGIRHAEIQRVDWKDIRLEDGIIEIHAANAKTASRRTIPILENLRKWLMPCHQSAGPVCEARYMAVEIDGLVKRINQRRKEKDVDEKFVWKHNALRHSFISYRVAVTQNVAQVALEAGNSPRMVFSNYRELVRPADAITWFAIEPDATGKVTVLPSAGEAAFTGA